MIRIEVVTCGRSGFIVAVETTEHPPGAPHDWDAKGTALVVGQCYRSSEDGKPERWTGWLWKQPGQYPPQGRHSSAISCAGPATELQRKLEARRKAHGEWWT